MADDLDDLEALVALATAPPAREAAPAARRGRRLAAPAVGVGGAAGGVLVEAGAAAPSGDDDGEAQELQALVELAGRPQGSRFEARSDELMRHARQAREKKRLQQELVAERTKRQRAEASLALVVASHPNIARSLGLTASAKLSETSKALVCMRLACAPRLRGSAFRNQACTQVAATSRVSSCILDLQSRFIVNFCSSPLDSTSDAQTQVLRSVTVITLQWDETSQKLRPFMNQKFASAKVSRAQTNMQVMVLSGSVHKFELRKLHVTGERVVRSSSSPWFAKSLQLEAQTTDCLLEGIVRSVLADITTREGLEGVVGSSEFSLILLGCDRAAPNICSAQWMCSNLHHNVKENRVGLHVEMCGLHGIAIVKSRAPLMKKSSAALFSFTRWTRIGSNRDALSARIQEGIAANFRVLRERRPEDVKRRSESLVELLYGGRDSPHLSVWSKRQNRRVPNGLCQDLQALARHVDFDCTTSRWTFWNYIEEGDEGFLGQGSVVGGPMYDSDDDCLEAVTVVVLNFVTGRGWAVAAEARWTNVFNSLRRFLISSACHGILTSSLRDWVEGFVLSNVPT